MSKLLATLCWILVLSLCVLNGIITLFIPEGYIILWYIASFFLGMLYADVGFKLYALGENHDE